MSEIIHNIEEKAIGISVQDMKRLLFRCAATIIALDKVSIDAVLVFITDLISYSKTNHSLLHYMVALPFSVFSPSAIAAGVEVWTWAIAEKPEMEVAIVSEILAAWTETAYQRKGIFSPAKKLEFYDLLFFNLY